MRALNNQFTCDEAISIAQNCFQTAHRLQSWASQRMIGGRLAALRRRRCSSRSLRCRSAQGRQLYAKPGEQGCQQHPASIDQRFKPTLWSL